MKLGLKALLVEAVTLDIGELFKDRTPNRIDVLVSKIENQEPMVLANGQSVILDVQANQPIVDILKTKDRKQIEPELKKGQMYARVFVDSHGNQYALNHFAKTGEFGGGGGGVRGGSVTEQLSEIGQILSLAIASTIDRPIEATDLTLENINQVKSFLDPEPSVQLINDVVNLIQTNKQWAKSFVEVANKLDAVIKLSGKTFHRDSQWTSQLKQTWTTANNQHTPRPFSNINKWNPADIWIVDKNLEVPSPGITLEELNQWMIEQYNTGKLYGISLKKTTAAATVNVYNLDPIGDQMKVVMKDLIITSSGRLEQLFKSKHTYMKYESIIPLSMRYNALMEADTEGKVQYRSFDSGQSIQGEIQGKKAAHGKIGFGSINAVLRSLTGKSITDMKNLKASISTPKGKREIVKHLIDMSQAVLGDNVTGSKRAQLIKQGMEWSDDNLLSKFQAVELLFHIHNFRVKHKKKADQFLTTLFQYASSQAPLSSVFIKVS